jgi:hypothetical protein
MFNFLVDFISSLFRQTPSISGHWRPTDFGEKHDYSDTQHYYGDLIILLKIQLILLLVMRMPNAHKYLDGIQEKQGKGTGPCMEETM